MTIRTPIYTF